MNLSHLTNLPEEVLVAARQFVQSPLPYKWSENEQKVLRVFFTNLSQRVFYMRLFPPNVGAVLFSMYSRMKNYRGVRGTFVDTFLPGLLETQLPGRQHIKSKEIIKGFKALGINSLDDFINYDDQNKKVFDDFVTGTSFDPEYYEMMASSDKAKEFLDENLDMYGHNSIGRVTSIWLGCEMISALAAKSFEWSRPGAGYVELSTRFVDMSTKDCYPIENELELYAKAHILSGQDSNQQQLSLRPDFPDKIRKQIIDNRHLSFTNYLALSGQNMDGLFPQCLNEKYAHLYSDDPGSLKSAIQGETCDILGNLLPASVLTSIGCGLSGEAFPVLIKHLILDNTAENIALAEAILDEAPKVGADQFARHFEPSEWEKNNWLYTNYSADEFAGKSLNFRILQGASSSVNPYQIKDTICALLELHRPDLPTNFWEHNSLCLSRNINSHDKLPSEFEAITLVYSGKISFRGWRDLQRMGLCTHFRTILTPYLGYYLYDKPHPHELDISFQIISGADKKLYDNLPPNVPLEMKQYVLSLGWNVGAIIGANLRQWEFCNWQRSSYNVNHEVRQAFLSIEKQIRQLLPWWEKLSRADTTPAYFFARGKKAIPLADVIKS